MLKYLILTEDQKKQLHNIAHGLLKLPYRLGAEIDMRKTPEQLKAENASIDCSELVEFMFYKIGYKVRDGSFNQYDDSAAIDEAQVEIGDLVFKRKANNLTAICHVGMVICKAPILICEADGYRGQVILKLFNEFKNVKLTAAQYAGLRRLLYDKVKKV